MKPAIPFPLSLALSAFLLAACGNKADLFMPPPPVDDEEVEPWDGEDPFAEEADDGEGADPFAEDDAPVSPPPVPTGAEPARAPVPPIDDDDADPPPAEPVDDE